MTLRRLFPPLAAGPQGRRARGWVGAWLLAALLLANLAPGLAAAAQLFSPATPAWALVCTAQGTHWVALDGEDDSTPAPAVAEHCLLCRLPGHDPLAPPPHGAGLTLPAASTAVPPPATATTPAPARRLLLMAAPRAPPRA